jgi:hypothetical protein
MVQGGQAAPCELEACPKMGAEEGKAKESDWQLSICFWTQAVTMAKMAACSAELRRRPWYTTTARENATWNNPEPKEAKAKSCMYPSQHGVFNTYLVTEQIDVVCGLSQEMGQCRPCNSDAFHEQKYDHYLKYQAQHNMHQEIQCNAMQGN